MFSRRSASEAISNGDSAETSSTKSASAESSSSPDRLLQRDRLLGDAHHVAHLAHGALELGGELGGARFAPELLDQLAFGVDQLVQPLDHVHGDPDRAALVRDRAGHRLADPPGRVGRELVAAAVVELLHRPDQAERALLDQVQERQPAPDVALGDRHHQAQVRLDHVLLGGDVAALDPLGEQHLLLGAQQRHAADRAQIQAQRVEARLDREVDFGRLSSSRRARSPPDPIPVLLAPRPPRRLRAHGPRHAGASGSSSLDRVVHVTIGSRARLVRGIARRRAPRSRAPPGG